MAEQLVLNAELRDKRQSPRRIRAEGKIPAICYGTGKKDELPPVLMLSVAPKEFAQVHKQGLRLVTLKISSGEERKVLVREVQRHPIRRDVPMHVDFVAVRLDRPMKIEVPLVLTGTPVGVKMGGVLQQVRRVIMVECLPDAIPEKIVHDVSDLDNGQAVHVADLKLPDGVRAVYVDNFTVANCQLLSEGKAEEATEEGAAEKK